MGAVSHSPAAGLFGMLAAVTSSVEVATILAGEPLALNMPEIWGVRLTGQLPDWVSAKDVSTGAVFGQCSGGVVLLRRRDIRTLDRLRFFRFGEGFSGDVCRGDICGGS